MILIVVPKERIYLVYTRIQFSLTAIYIFQKIFLYPHFNINIQITKF